MSNEKEIRWVGSAYDELLAFPDEPRRSAGFQLGKVQVGLDPDDWKPFDDVGAGAVLHCFQEKTQATSKQDKAIAEARYRAVVNARKAQK